MIRCLSCSGLLNTVKINDKNYLDYVDRRVLENVINKDTGDDLGIPEEDGVDQHEQLVSISKFKNKRA